MRLARVCRRLRPRRRLCSNAAKDWSALTANDVSLRSNSAIKEEVPQVPRQAESLEIKDPALIFDLVWTSLCKKHGEENLAFPKDIMWLAGAPGSGKGVLTGFLSELRGITAVPIEVSQLLQGPQVEKIKAEGKLVSDRVVIELLLEQLLDARYARGVLVDGFPRTTVQGECIKLLYDKMFEIRAKYEGKPEFERFRRPIFHITVLFIDEDLSIERQLRRGREVTRHNKRVKETGVGTLKALRPTDVDPELSRQRYMQFKDEIYESLQSIKAKFHFHFIDADGTLDQVQNRIRHEMEYQSAMELSEETFEKIRTLPLSNEIVKNARHELVRRLDSYERLHPVLFDEVISNLDTDFFPIIRRQALSGCAVIRSESKVFAEPLAVDMALDILTERGYTAILDVSKVPRITGIDPHTFKMITCKVRVYEFQISFPKPSIR